MARIAVLLCLAIIALSEGKAVQRTSYGSDVKSSVDVASVASLKEVLNDPQLQKYIGSLTEEQKELIRKHPSQAKALLDALHSHANKGATSKRSEIPTSSELQKYISKLPADQQALIRAHPSEAKALLDALHRSSSAAGDRERPAPAKKQVEEEDVSSSEEILQKLMPHIAALQDIMQDIRNHERVDTADVEALKQKVVADVTLAKENGIKLEDILQSMQRQDRDQ
jgi:hypothetical protein